MNLTKKLTSILDKIPTIGATAKEENPTVYLKFFNTLGRGEWYAIEMNFTGKDFIMFGYVKSPLGEDCDEFGSFTLSELMGVNEVYGFEVIDLDLNFEPCKINEVI